jgi:hypothetical protein
VNRTKHIATSQTRRARRHHQQKDARSERRVSHRARARRNRRLAEQRRGAVFDRAHGAGAIRAPDARRRQRAAAQRADEHQRSDNETYGAVSGDGADRAFHSIVVTTRRKDGGRRCV